MKNSVFLSEKFRFLEVKFSIYLNRRVFIMDSTLKWLVKQYRFNVNSRWSALNWSCFNVLCLLRKKWH